MKERPVIRKVSELAVEPKGCILFNKNSKKKSITIDRGKKKF